MRKILLLFDLPETVPVGFEFRQLLKENTDYKDERDVLYALEKLGHEVTLLGIFDDISPLIARLKQSKTDLVFLMCETFLNERNLAAHLVSFLEMLKVNYTGAPSSAMSRCADKALSKMILQHHGIAVPEFLVLAPKDSIEDLKEFSFPAIIKPTNLEASEGISQKSIVHNFAQAKSRIQFLRKKYRCSIIAERYIDGRELYVGVIGNQTPRVFPPREMRFSKEFTNHKIASYRAKWDKEYRKKWGIRHVPAKQISPTLGRDLKKRCDQIYKALGLKGYARLDLRVDEEEKIYFIEANANPAINRNDDFARSAANAGVDYEQLIAKIVELALQS